MEDFFEAVADWSDRQSIPVSFSRCEYDGWYASIHLSDGVGPYTATLDLMRPKYSLRGHPDREAAYRHRIFAALSRATVRARERRVRQLAGTINGLLLGEADADIDTIGEVQGSA